MTVKQRPLGNQASRQQKDTAGHVLFTPDSFLRGEWKKKKAVANMNSWHVDAHTLHTE